MHASSYLCSTSTPSAAICTFTGGIGARDGISTWYGRTGSTTVDSFIDPLRWTDLSAPRGGQGASEGAFWHSALREKAPRFPGQSWPGNQPKPGRFTGSASLSGTSTLSAEGPGGWGWPLKRAWTAPRPLQLQRMGRGAAEGDTKYSAPEPAYKLAERVVLRSFAQATRPESRSCMQSRCVKFMG